MGNALRWSGENRFGIFRAVMSRRNIANAKNGSPLIFGGVVKLAKLFRADGIGIAAVLVV
jgi:hypothetical protein